MILRKNRLFLIELSGLVGIFITPFLWISLTLVLSDLARIKRGSLASQFEKSLLLIKKCQIILIVVQFILVLLYVGYLFMDEIIYKPGYY